MFNAGIDVNARLKPTWVFHRNVAAQLWIIHKDLLLTSDWIDEWRQECLAREP